MATTRLPESSPHYVPPPPPEFGNPLDIKKYGKRRRKLAPTGKPTLLGKPETDAITIQGAAGEKAPRSWETIALDLGTNTERPVEGRFYTIGKKHSLVDVWTSPPGTWGAKRIAGVKNCMIFAVKEDRKSTDDDSKEPSGWTKALVFNGVSRSESSIPREFDHENGISTFVSMQWEQIRR